MDDLVRNLRFLEKKYQRGKIPIGTFYINGTFAGLIIIMLTLPEKKPVAKKPFDIKN